MELETGNVLPPFALYVDTSQEYLQLYEKEVGDSVNHELHAHVQALSLLRESLYMNEIENETSFREFKKKSDAGRRVLRQRQRELEEQLLLCCLDYLHLGEIMVLFEVSRSWNALANLKLYMTKEIFICPLEPTLWHSYKKDFRNCSLEYRSETPIEMGDSSKIITSVSPKMIDVLLLQLLSNFHHRVSKQRFSVTKNDSTDRTLKSTSGRNSSSMADNETSKKPKSPKGSPPSKARAKSQSQRRETVAGAIQVTNAENLPRIPNMSYVLMDIPETASPYANLSKLSLVSVVIDQESIQYMGLLRKVETLHLHFVKIRLNGLFGKCCHCQSESHKLSNMFLCRYCHSINSATCSPRCRKEHHPRHVKSCAVLSQQGHFHVDRSQKAKHRSKLGDDKDHLHVSRDHNESDTENDGTELLNDAEGLGSYMSGIARCGWLDGANLKGILDAFGQSLKVLSIDYVIPCDFEESNVFVKSFEPSNYPNGSLFSSVSFLTSLSLREIHESLVASSTHRKQLNDRDTRKKKAALRSWKRVKAFSSTNIRDVAINCPLLQILDLGGSGPNGVIIPVGISLPDLTVLSSNCKDLRFLGYISFSSDFISCILMVDNEILWPSLLSLSCQVSPSNIHELLEITRAKSSTGEKMGFVSHREIPKSYGRAHRDADTDEYEGEKRHNEFRWEEHYSYLDDLGLNSDEGSSDTDMEDYKVADCGNEIERREYGAFHPRQYKLKEFMLNFNLEGRESLSEEDTADSISFIRHLLNLTLGTVNASEVQDGAYSEFHEIKGIVLNRYALKLDFSSELGRSCVFLPRHFLNDNTMFYIIVEFLEHEGMKVIVDSTERHMTGVSRCSSCHVKISPVHLVRNFIGVEGTQSLYYVIDINLTPESAQEHTTPSSKTAIIVHVENVQSIESSTLGMSALLQGIVKVRKLAIKFYFSCTFDIHDIFNISSL